MCGFKLKFDKTPNGIQTLLACIEQLEKLRWTYTVEDLGGVWTVTV